MTVASRHYDVIVIGGGLVGMAVAYGLVTRGQKVLVLDEGDRALRAARANFGLIWTQTKGHTYRPYAVLSRRAAGLWGGFADELTALTGDHLGYQRDGGFYLCLSEADWAQRAAMMRHQFDEDLPVAGAYEMLERGPALDKLLPGLGAAVVGACCCRLDGAANPLRVLRALHAAYKKCGGVYLPGPAVTEIVPSAHGGGFAVGTPGSRYGGDRVVLAAGLGNATLAPFVDLEVAVGPLRGQILVTQKLPPTLAYPTFLIRQMDEGGFILGDSHEDVGFDDGTDVEVMTMIARRAVASFSFLADVQMVRAWSGLRVMTDDGVPLYLASARHRGAYALSTHSGVTLAALHAREIAPAIIDGTLDTAMPAFAARTDAVTADS